MAFGYNQTCGRSAVFGGLPTGLFGGRPLLLFGGRPRFFGGRPRLLGGRPGGRPTLLTG